MGRRRSRRLQKKEIEKAKARMSSTSSAEAVEPIIQNSPIFDPESFDALPNIVNNLDPGSFVRLARTCKDMNFTCFNNNNRIKIPCWDKNSAIGHASVDMTATNCVLFTTKRFRQYSADSDFVKNLAKMPFVFNVGLIIRRRVDERTLRELRSYFSNFPRVSVGRILVFHIVDWEGVVEFIKDFRVNAVTTWARTVDDRWVEAPSLEILTFLTQNLSAFVGHFYIPDDIILRATTKNLIIRKARISKETFKELIKKFAAGDFKEWTIGREPFMVDDEGSDYDDDFEDIEANENELDPFIEAISEVMKVVEVEDIDQNVYEPSTAYFTPSASKQFFILKSNGSVGTFIVFHSRVDFGDVGI